MLMNCPEQQIKDEMGNKAKTNANDNAEDDEVLAKILEDSADPFPVSQGDGTVRWQGVAV